MIHLIAHKKSDFFGKKFLSIKKNHIFVTRASTIETQLVILNCGYPTFSYRYIKKEDSHLISYSGCGFNKTTE